MSKRLTERERRLDVHTIDYSAPPSEILRDPESVSRLWPDLYQDRVFAAQIESHYRTSQNINALLDKLPPQLSIQEALTQKIVTSAETADFYKSLKSIIDSDDGRRLILYLPFEFIPSPEWKTGDQNADQAVLEFCSVFTQNWVKLLTSHDVRANFEDGNIIETAVRKTDHPRVVKAAHLIPEMVNKNLLSKKQVFGLLESGDPMILKSVGDVLPIMLDWRQIDQEDYDWYSFLNKYRRDDFAGETITQEREKWLNQVKKEEEILSQSRLVCSQVLADNISTLPDNAEFFVEGVRMAIESLYPTDEIRAKKIFDTYQDQLVALWESSDEIKRRLTTAFRHFYHLGLIDKSQIEKLGVQIPSLFGNYSENLFLLSSENEKLKGIVTDFATDEELKDLVLPVILIGGSKVKGYGEPASDTDVSVFIRPGVPESSKDLIRSRIRSVFEKHDFHETPVEFRLGEETEGLKIINPKDLDHWTGEDYWLYALMDSFWLGNRDDVENLMAQLLPNYFYENSEIMWGNRVRELHLQGMERDLLQYRLMHKGYERSYPLLENSYQKYDSVGGRSAYWDSGYRRTATRLFVNNIFLPRISKIHSRGS